MSFSGTSPEEQRKDLTMKILITGSTGLVGNALAKRLKTGGHTVCRLIRPGTAAESIRTSDGFDVGWNPESGELGGAAVGADAVVNLAGASIAGGRWTTDRKHLLRSSRVNSTRALVAALAKMSIRPSVLISASAIGYYGNRGDELLTEASQPGKDLLSEIAREWEAEAGKAEALGIRVVCTRFGVILARDGGALPKMLTPFKLGVGGKIGSGKQWMSWITLEEVLGVLQLALEEGTMRGPVNVVSPQPVRNAEFTQALAKILHRPRLFPAPAFALRLLLGEMADALLLASQRVVPAELERIGYRFIHTDLPSALIAVLS
jgi:uncharacterized protein (TIGR01777 family)